jgi:hypothetical protein
MDIIAGGWSIESEGKGWKRYRSRSLPRLVKLERWNGTSDQPHALSYLLGGRVYGSIETAVSSLSEGSSLVPEKV